MNILSLFDGISCLQLALNRANIAYDNYYASEIKKSAIKVTQSNFPNTIQLGDIKNIHYKDGVLYTENGNYEVGTIDIMGGGSPCFVEGTSILTNDGMKAVEDVKVGNAVLGDDCKWHKVVKTMVNPASVIYTIKAQGLLETKATANHPIYVRHMKRHYPTCEDGRRCTERVFSKPEYVAVKDLEKGDFIGFPILQYENNRMNITPEEAWLVGRYIADGYVNNSPRKDRPKGQYNHKVIFCIGKGKVENFKAHVNKYHVCLKKDATVTKGEIISERLMEFCLMCGKWAGNKEIPGDFLNLPNNLLKALLDGYMSGDGCESNGINKATTISKNLALSLQVAVHKAYEVPVKIYFSKRPQKAVILGREINQHNAYQVTWLDEVSKQSQAIVEDGYIWQPIRSITKEEVKTSVYNFEVDDVHSYTANGMMVHNCQDFSIANIHNHEYGLKGERSKLFFEYLRLLHEVKPKYFLLENVKMKSSAKEELDNYLGTTGMYINSNLVSYQNRPRYYWTNIPNVVAPEDRHISFQDYKETNPLVCAKYKLKKTPSRLKMWNNGCGSNSISTGCANVTFEDKIYCITARQDRCPNSGLIECEDFCRFLTRAELEQAQTIPVGYTDMLSYNQMQDVVGNAWTVDVIVHILSFYTKASDKIK